MVEKTVTEINERIEDGDVRVVTADEMTELVEELGPEEAAREVDVVTTGTFGAMCSSGAFVNFGHSDPPIKMQKVWLNDVEAYTGVAAVDAYIGAAQLSEDRGIEYGGAHVIEDLVAGRPIEVQATAYGTDCYPRKKIETTITIEDLNQAIMINPRNAYQRYNAATNSGDRTLYTYMGTLLPDHGNVTYSGSGLLSPLSNDPDYEIIGLGTRILIGGATGYIIGEGTQHDPMNKMATLMVKGDLKQMNPEYLRAARFHGYGITLYIGIGVAIPILNERMAKKTAVRDSDLVVNIVDYAEKRRPDLRPVVRRVSYEELKSGHVDINEKEVPTSPLSSYFMAKKVAENLKSELESGNFYLTTPIERLPVPTESKPMKQIEKPLVRDVLTKDIPKIGSDATIEDASKLITKSGFTHLPVVTKENELVGIVTAWDIARAVAEKKDRLVDIVTAKVITAEKNETVELAVEKIREHNISALPVVENNKVIGMVTSDNISKLAIR